jgi:hypothetical protein
MVLIAAAGALAFALILVGRSVRKGSKAAVGVMPRSGHAGPQHMVGCPRSHHA